MLKRFLANLSIFTRLVLVFLQGIILLAIPSITIADTDPFSKIIRSMNLCYETQNKVGVELAKCMVSELDKSSNSEGYRVFITDENPNKSIESDIKMVIYNRFGYIYTCYGKAGERINFNRCEGKRVLPLSSGKERSILPP